MSLTDKKVDALCVVAHPDDETIWMGGTILENPDWNWTIISLCRKNDSDRAPKFKKVCEFLGANGIISDLDDEHLEPLAISEVIEKIKDNLPRKNYDYVYTHGRNGEYGHLRHKEVYQAVKKMVKEREIECKKVLSFSYLPGGVRWKDSDLRIPISNTKADVRFCLSDDALQKKIELVTKVYGFDPESFEALSCGSRETFHELKMEDKNEIVSVVPISC
jgi:LmbE family N-acetylglucosaminyl deacetylase